MTLPQTFVVPAGQWTSFGATPATIPSSGRRPAHSLASRRANERKRAMDRGECVFPPMASPPNGRECLIPPPLRSSQGRPSCFPRGERHVEGLRTMRKTGNALFPLLRAAQRAQQASFPRGKGARRGDRVSFPSLPAARKVGKNTFPRGNGIEAAFGRCAWRGTPHSLLHSKLERGGKLHSPARKRPRLGCVRLVKETRRVR